MLEKRNKIKKTFLKGFLNRNGRKERKNEKL